MMPLVAFLAAVLAGLGVGSGGFLLLYLTDVAGLPQYTAQGVNLVFFTVATLASTLASYRAGRLSVGRLLPLLILGGIGSIAGALLTLAVPPELARRAFGGVMVAGGLYTLLSRILRMRRAKTEKKQGSPPKIP